jgi:LysM repeat protein
MSIFSARKHKFGAIVLLISFISACSSPSPNQSQQSAATAELTLYATATQPSSQFVPDQAEEIVETPAASPTPFIHIVVANDTLLGIAQRYGISLDALLVANPTVSANFLSLGMEIFVPQGEAADLTVFALATLPPLDLTETICYPTAAGELWCFLLVLNNVDTPIESPLAEITLFDSTGATLDTVQASAPLNLLRPNESMPLLAYWASPPEAWQSSTGKLIAAYQVADSADRYINASLPDTNIEISEDGLSAKLTGNLNPDTFAEASLVWLLAVAYDSEDKVLGVRRWEGTGENDSFEFWIYSLAGKIDRVEILIEARP